LAEDKKISKVDYAYNGQPEYTETYTYDNKGRLAGYTYDIDVEAFEYIGDNFLKVTRRNKVTNAVTAYFEAVINDKGAITELNFKRPDGFLASQYTYTYDADGYMVKNKSVNVSTNITWAHEYKIENGNAVSVKVFQNGVHVSNGESSYDKAYVATVPQAPNYFWLSSTLFGRPLKNVVNEYKEFKLLDGSLTAHIIYTNQYDGTGRLKTQDLNNVLTGKKGAYSFTYQ
jgi:hypothetical protein